MSEKETNESASVPRPVQAIVRFFGFRGSWKWACRQMKRGSVVRPRSATGTVKYRLDDEGQQRLQWTFDRDAAMAKWENANFFLRDQESTDWEIVKPNPVVRGATESRTSPSRCSQEDRK